MSTFTGYPETGSAVKNGRARRMGRQWETRITEPCYWLLYKERSVVGQSADSFEIFVSRLRTYLHRLNVWNDGERVLYFGKLE